MLGRAAVIDDQRAAADRLGDVSEHFAMREARAGHATAAMQAQQHAILGRALGYRPQAGRAIGIRLEIVDTTRIGGQVAAFLQQVAQLIDAHLRIGAECGDEIVEQNIDGGGLWTGHGVSPVCWLMSPDYTTEARRR